MPIELEQVILLEQEIVVLVDLPKAAIDHIEMLVGEIVPNLVHVLGPVEVAPRADKVRLATLELLPMLDLTQLSNYLTLKGSFSAASKPNFASTYALESSRRDLQNVIRCTVL